MHIKEIKLLVNNLAATKYFYHQLLELPVVLDNKTFISFQAGSSLLTFQGTKEKNPVYHFAFNIPCNKIDEALQWLESKKVKLIHSTTENAIIDFKNWNAKALYFFDNSGNVLELIARFDLKNKDAKEFTSASIVSISEIAIVADDVIGTANDLVYSHGINYFDKQPLSENFAALGDDHGLFILSKTGRTWFLTDLPSKKYWQMITIEKEGKQEEILFNN